MTEADIISDLVACSISIVESGAPVPEAFISGVRGSYESDISSRSRLRLLAMLENHRGTCGSFMSIKILSEN